MAAVKVKRARKKGKTAKPKTVSPPSSAGKGADSKNCSEAKSSATRKPAQAVTPKTGEIQAERKPAPPIKASPVPEIPHDPAAAPRSLRSYWEHSAGRARKLLVDGVSNWPARLVSRLKQVVAYLTPTGLYKRTLIIIVAPIVLLEGVVAFVFMERHWQAVTRRLSEATARDVGALIEVYKNYPSKKGHTRLIDLARDKMNLSLRILPAGDLPPPVPKPFFALLDLTLSREIGTAVDHPFWIDTVGKSRHIEIRVKLDDAVLRFIALRSQTFASNSHIFLLWMVGSSVVLLTVAILFLNNQIKPILRLSEAAEAFGKGHPVPEEFRPRGAKEVRQAAHAFMEMRDRIKTHVDQRTTMLAAVSHDLRTVLTRFRLELELLGDNPEIDALQADVGEMQHMLEEYLAFAKGDGGEEATPTDLRELMEEIVEDAQHMGRNIKMRIRKGGRGPVLTLKPQAFKRALTNLISNAARFGDDVIVNVAVGPRWLRVDVEDDGPGIAPKDREEVFKPFSRLDHARNQDQANSGLGLAIARDIARSHGGDIILGVSAKLGGLRASMRVPL